MWWRRWCWICRECRSRLEFGNIHKHCSRWRYWSRCNNKRLGRLLRRRRWWPSVRKFTGWVGRWRARRHVVDRNDMRYFDYYSNCWGCEYWWRRWCSWKSRRQWCSHLKTPFCICLYEWCVRGWLHHTLRLADLILHYNYFSTWGSRL